jgi:hypothetical protein
MPFIDHFTEVGKKGEFLPALEYYEIFKQDWNNPAAGRESLLSGHCVTLTSDLIPVNLTLAFPISYAFT